MLFKQLNTVSTVDFNVHMFNNDIRSTRLLRFLILWRVSLQQLKYRRDINESIPH
jgi:hypothetical protein